MISYLLGSKICDMKQIFVSGDMPRIHDES